jgi:3'-phosphoadenosine 5'-phosphosulfate sulfotransferase (PAPS reductase)/FAD synthetase
MVCFASTSKAVEATLRFVCDCAERWQVPIHWLEYRTTEAGFAVVDFDTASREGEPFEALIRKRQYLPSPVARGCTTSLKIQPMHKFGRTEWDQFIGIHADEQRASPRFGLAAIPRNLPKNACACRWPASPCAT